MLVVSMKSRIRYLLGGSHSNRPCMTCVAVVQVERVSDINPPIIMDTIIPTSFTRLEMTISFGVKASANVLNISKAVHSIEIAAKPIVIDSHLISSSAHLYSHYEWFGILTQLPFHMFHPRRLWHLRVGMQICR